VLDIRFVPPMTSRQVLEEIEGLLGRGVSAEPVVIGEPTRLSPDVQITKEVTSMPTRFIRSSGGSDGRFFCAQGIPVLLSRPCVRNLHGWNEWIDLGSMVSYFEICQSYILSQRPQA
jgi:succinyl-diaminopimelate desuccinylase